MADQLVGKMEVIVTLGETKRILESLMSKRVILSHIRDRLEILEKLPLPPTPKKNQKGYLKAEQVKAHIRGEMITQIYEEILLKDYIQQIE